jgi:hypothetical protein
MACMVVSSVERTSQALDDTSGQSSQPRRPIRADQAKTFRLFGDGWRMGNRFIGTGEIALCVPAAATRKGARHHLGEFATCMGMLRQHGVAGRDCENDRNITSLLQGSCSGRDLRRSVAVTGLPPTTYVDNRAAAV